MNHSRLHIRVSLIAACVLSLSTSSLMAQENYPSRPLRIIATYTAGTGADLLSRIVANAMSPLLGQPIIVENRPGAGGMVGTDYGAKAPADGYTLTMATPGTLIVIPAMSKSVRYDTEKDFTAIGAVARSAYVVVTGNSPEAPKSFKELLTRVKEKGGTYGIPGIGSTTHLAGEVVLQEAQVSALAVPYAGSSQMLTDVVSGQILFGFNTVGATLQLVKGGKLNALAVTSAERVESLPDVPTVSESGMPGMNLVGWWGFVAPKETPAAIVKKLSDTLIKVLESPEVKEKFAALEVRTYPLDASAFNKLIRQETPLWANLVRENKLTSD